MKRLLFVVLAACTLALLAMVGVAVADGGPHGGYTPTTDGCAGCHRAHTAQAPLLLTAPVGELCLSCHGSTATGADTNVADGVYTDRDLTPGEGEGVVGRGLKGGGFLNTLMNTDFSAAAASSASTSAHTYDGALGTAWGNGPISSGPGLADFSLECTNCHDPHGNGNYRILRPIPTNSGAAAGVAVPEETTKTYTISSAAGVYFGQGYPLFGDPASSARSDMPPEYQDLSDWCSACHTRYLALPNSARTDSGDTIFAYRHMAGYETSGSLGGVCTNCHTSVPELKEGITFNDGQFRHDVECMTCHVAHGTSASMAPNPTGFAGTVPWPDGSDTPSGDARSSLLRVDGRGVCQGCHNKSPAP